MSSVKTAKYLALCLARKFPSVKKNLLKETIKYSWAIRKNVYPTFERIRRYYYGQVNDHFTRSEAFYFLQENQYYGRNTPRLKHRMLAHYEYFIEKAAYDGRRYFDDCNCLR